MRLPPEMLAVIERETKLARIRRSLTDLQASEAAPRLNAQVRLREEHVEMLQFLQAELERTEDERDEVNNTLTHYAMNCRTAMGCW